MKLVLVFLLACFVGSMATPLFSGVDLMAMKKQEDERRKKAAKSKVKVPEMVDPAKLRGSVVLRNVPEYENVTSARASLPASPSERIHVIHSVNPLTKGLPYISSMPALSAPSAKIFTLNWSIIFINPL